MARYIDADALQAQLERKKAGVANQRYTEGWNDCMMRVKSMVSTAPTADVASVRYGEWKDRDRSGLKVYQGWVASCCDMWNDVQRNYCPHCGAKMYWKR